MAFTSEKIKAKYGYVLDQKFSDYSHDTFHKPTLSFDIKKRHSLNEINTNYWFSKKEFELIKEKYLLSSKEKTIDIE
ncbi:hypothetical protein Celal_2548 [Cellulophaga algicola DSM 14237]|uniref:Uncharacterized protein n=1 Tax=Cellulophaga algicola (strain DSM 14237 / IC166 / ACAM 630) TaxID=688270 RepID=E6X9R5_CELAD|nr:hypothetical protein [Cellulophaga algicola]ADV49835.1 hypothetical protein Celal_2548 [Cellulophaga algicola DSM 14237]